MVELHNSARRILDDLINDFQVDNFTRFFREKNRSFAPRTEALSQYDDAHFRNGVKLGEIKFAQDEKMLICAFEANQPLSERSGKKAQYEKGKKILKESQSDAGIFIFYSNSQFPLNKGGLRGLSEDRGLSSFRFSLIYPEYTGTKRQWSYFKRFTYFVSPELTNKTFLQQIGEGDFSSLQKIKEAFSVDPVTKQFYNELQSWHFWAMDKIKFPDDYKYSNDPAKDKEIRNATNLIRLITRIIFIWFLTEKGLVPPQVFSREKLRSIVKDFMNGKKATNFYNAILQNLFFGTLNQKMDERKFAQESGFQTNKKEYGIKNLFRYGDKFLIAKDEVLKLFKDIPFLNGGLFDCLDKEDEAGKVIYVDGFSRNPAKQTNIPDYLFFQQAEERVDLSGYGLGSNRPVRGLIEILNSYNFTIDENTPVDQEIALDPELLGKVFENLLASYNPETATTARKATGSYYTPREIVDYMVQESLIAYLTTALERHSSTLSCHSRPVSKYWVNSNGNPENPPSSPFFKGGNQNNPTLAKGGKGGFEESVESHLRQLLSYSDEIPAFSNEETQKIISSIDNIKILDPACGSGAFPMGILHKLVYVLQKLDPENKYWHELQYKKALKEFEDVFKQEDKNEREERLKEINEAFDEGINYPDYARKLYLIENCIYGVDIQPIAIQISKLRFFISLVLDQKVDRGKENLGIMALPNLETKFVAANTLIGLEMPEQLTLKNPEIEKKEEELKQIRHKYFDTKTRKEKLDYQKKDAQIRKEIADLLKNSGWDTSTAEKIANFDLYDQNASADFFDSEWMFGIKNPSPLAGEGKGEEGFDVVIANPPYLESRHPSFSEELKSTYQMEIKKQWHDLAIYIPRGADLLIYFFASSLCFINNTGVIVFITQNSWLNSDYGKKFQAFLLKTTNVKAIIDSDYKYFDSKEGPNINTVISIFEGKKTCPNNKIIFARYHENFQVIPFSYLESDKLSENHFAESKEFRYSNENLTTIKWGILLHSEDFVLNLIQVLKEKAFYIDKISDSNMEIGQGLNLSKEFIVTREFVRNNYLSHATIPFFTSGDGAPFVLEDTTHFIIDKSKLTKDENKFISSQKIKPFDPTLTKKIMPILFMPRGIGRHFCAMNIASAFTASCVDIYDSERNTSEEVKLNLWLFLNSSVLWLLREISGRKNLGGGMLKAEATDLKSFPLYMQFKKQNEIFKIYEALSKRQAEDTVEELFSEEHKQIDKLVFDYLGVTEDIQSKTIAYLEKIIKERHTKSKS